MASEDPEAPPTHGSPEADAPSHVEPAVHPKLSSEVLFENQEISASASEEQAAEVHQPKSNVSIEDKKKEGQHKKASLDPEVKSPERRHSSQDVIPASPSIIHAVIDKEKGGKKRSSGARRRSTRASDYSRSISRGSRGNRSIASIKRGSISEIRSKGPKYMNSYKLNSERPFNPDKVQSILAEILEQALDANFVYNSEHCPNQAKMISAAIRARVKDEDFDRYKIVCLVTLGEKKSYDMYTILRFLWDADRDRYATYKFENMSVFAVATVFGIYYE